MARRQVIDWALAGVPEAASGHFYALDAGGTTQKSVYSSLTSAAVTQPLVFDSTGRVLVYAEGSYKFEIYDSVGTLVKSIDNVCYGEDNIIHWGGTATLSGGNYLITSPTPQVNSYYNGLTIAFIPDTVCVNAPGININSLGNKPLYQGTDAISTAQLKAGLLYVAIYNGTGFEVLNPTNTLHRYWLPTLGKNGAGITWATGTINQEHYSIERDWVRFVLDFDGTIGGTPGAGEVITFTLPVTADYATNLFTCLAYEAGATSDWKLTPCWSVDETTGYLYKPGGTTGSTFATGTARFHIEGQYPRNI
jgi:hypothetical protein